MLPALIALLVAGAILLALLAGRGLVVEVPQDDRRYMDRPPKFYRLTWPLVRMVDYYCGWLMSDTSEATTLETLRRAGQDYTLTARQFFAGKIVASLFVAALFAFAAAMIGSNALVAAIAGAAPGFFMPKLWLAEMTKKRNLQILKRLPYFLDVVTLAVEAGMNLSSALQKAVEKAPPGPLVSEVNRVLRDVRGGKARVDALRDMSTRLNFPVINSLVSALVQGELMGSSIGSILRAQAEQRRTERFQRAEKLALEAPVKMLGPLLFCIFPCTFIVIGFPIAIKLMTSGL